MIEQFAVAKLVGVVILSQPSLVLSTPRHKVSKARRENRALMRGPDAVEVSPPRSVARADRRRTATFRAPRSRGRPPRCRGWAMLLEGSIGVVEFRPRVASVQLLPDRGIRPSSSTSEKSRSGRMHVKASGAKRLNIRVDRLC